eukprot:11764588-Heterocapsa_arctica.AAC.1
MVAYICEQAGLAVHSVAGYQFISGDKERCVIAFRDVASKRKLHRYLEAQGRSIAYFRDGPWQDRIYG